MWRMYVWQASSDCSETRKAWRAKAQLELVHSVLWSLNKPSLASARYLLTFIDDFPRYTWVYFLKNKSHVLEKFKEYVVTMWPTYEMLKIRQWRRRCRQGFWKVLVMECISWQRSKPYTPQQNVVVERKNQTLVEIACRLFQAKGFSTKFWEESVYCSNYLLNLIPNKAMSVVDPVKKWS